MYYGILHNQCRLKNGKTLHHMTSLIITVKESKANNMLHLNKVREKEDPTNI